VRRENQRRYENAKPKPAGHQENSLRVIAKSRAGRILKPLLPANKHPNEQITELNLWRSQERAA
jgi:hypothetical protein